MRVWLYRWPNGDTSIVWARNKVDALELLDEFGQAELAGLKPLPPGAIDLTLEDDGELAKGQITSYVFDKLDEQYPILMEAKEALEADPRDEIDELEYAAEIRTAVNLERERVTEECKPAKTERGRMLQERMSLSGPVADKWAFEYGPQEGPTQ